MEVHREWHLRFAQQFRALFWKNALIAWRNWKATFVRVMAPFIFLLLVWLIDKALQANEELTEETKVRRSPATETIGNIPNCEDDLYIRGNCLSFLYTVESSNDVTASQAREIVDGIVDFMRENNDPKIPMDKVVYHDNRTSVNQWFLQNPEKALGAVHFHVDSAGRWIDFSLQTNSTSKYFKGNFQNPNFFFQLPFQNAIQRAVAVHHLKSAGRITSENEISWFLGYREYPHPAFDTDSVAGTLLGPFLFAANMFGVVTQMNAMVSEKQLGMKQALRTMGMLDSAYWCSWAAWEITLNFFTSLLNVAFGSIFQFKFFLDNSFVLVFLLLFLFQLSMVAIGFALSSLINKVVVSTVLGFVLFVLGWMTYTVQEFGIPYTSEYFRRLMWLTVIATALPWNIFMKGVRDLSSATSNSESSGLSFERRFSYCRDEDGADTCENEAADVKEYIDCECVLALGHLYWILIILSVGYFLLATYIDKVVPNEFGVRLHPFYFFDPRYWGFSGRGLFERRYKTLTIGNDVQREIDADVQAEIDKMEECIAPDGQPASENRPVELFRLQKRFNFKFFAMKGSSYAIDKGELFCLLGPNGAGKTTTINCLTGVLPPSGGTAFVYGNSITAAGGMDEIRSMMGVCPQFDVLWPMLSGIEHVWIFGLVKGIPFKKVATAANASLKEVNLVDAKKQLIDTYSGGMKRRLSVAIALLGNPKIVFLDEPTTGMDPISRRYVWDIIEKAKAGRAIVLTTHSMEEADILGDRICIMARGDVRAIGTSIRLKQKFGAGYVISVSVNKNGSASQTSHQADVSDRYGRVREFFHLRLGLRPKEENDAYITYLIPREKERDLPGFLKHLEDGQSGLGIDDIHLSLSTLEEVFLRIAQEAELEALRAEGVTQFEVPFTDGMKVLVEIGQTNFVHPITGVRYDLTWGPNDAGTFTLNDIETDGPVPDGAAEPDLSRLG